MSTPQPELNIDLDLARKYVKTRAEVLANRELQLVQTVKNATAELQQVQQEIGFLNQMCQPAPPKPEPVKTDEPARTDEEA